MSPASAAALPGSTLDTSAPAGEKVMLNVWREGKKMTLTAKIRSADEQVASADDHTGGSASAATLGLTVRPLTREEREQVGVTTGLVVENAEGKAAQAGIQEGDVLLGVDGTPVESVAQLRKLVQEKHKRAALLIQRGDDRLFVPIALG